MIFWIMHLTSTKLGALSIRDIQIYLNIIINIPTFYLKDGTIGDDLVVKPISAKVRSHIQEDSAQYKSQPFAGMYICASCTLYIHSVDKLKFFRAYF